MADNALFAPGGVSRSNALAPSGVEATLMFDPRYREWLRQMGGAQAVPQIAAPGGDYNYAAAIGAGVVPEAYQHDAGRQHWPSSVEVAPYAEPMPLKSAGHPTAWMERFMRATGVDPNEAGAEVWAQALAMGAGPRLDRTTAENRAIGVPGDRLY